MQGERKERKRMIGSKADEVTAVMGAPSGTPERPGWGQIVLEKGYLYGNEEST